MISESQSYLKNTEETQFRYDTGLSSRELEDAIRREVLRNRLVGQVNVTEADTSMDQLRSEGLRRWNMDMDIEYQYETFNGQCIMVETNIIRMTRRSSFLMLRRKWKT